MSKFLATMILLAVVIIIGVTYFYGSTNSSTVQGQTQRVGTKMITDLKTVAP